MSTFWESVESRILIIYPKRINGNTSILNTKHNKKPSMLKNFKWTIPGFFSLFILGLFKNDKIYSKVKWKIIHLRSGAGTRTHNHAIVSLFQCPLPGPVVNLQNTLCMHLIYDSGGVLKYFSSHYLTTTLEL